MTTVLERKIYDLVTKSENFEFAFEVHERFEGIKETLRKEFWIDLQKAIKSAFKEFNYELIDDFIDLIPSPNPKNRNQSYYFWLSSDFEVQIGVGFVKKVSRQKFREICGKYEDLKSNLPLFDFQEEQEDSWLFRNFDEDMNSLHGLKKILPDNRQELVDEYINAMKSLIEKTIDDVNEIEKLF